MSVETTIAQCAIAAPLLFSALFAQAYAAGMVPETTLLVIEESTHSGTMNVKNTDTFPALIYTIIVDLPDDTGVTLNACPLRLSRRKTPINICGSALT